MSFLHPHVCLLTHGIAHQFRPMSIVFVRGFRTPLDTSYGVSHCHSHSPQAMATKQKCEDNKPMVHSPDTLRTLLFSAITNYKSPEVALLHIMKKYNFYMSVLQQILAGSSILF
jgi:hypothetical protein